MPLTAHLEEIGDPAALEPRWRAVEEAAEAPSFFLRWTWMGSWLGALRAAGIGLPRLLAISDAGQDIALALIGEGRVRRKFGDVPALWLNQAGDPQGDRPFIEYNGLLCRWGAASRSVHAFCDAMAKQQGWRALHLSGLLFGSPLIDVPGIRRKTLRDASPAYYVDLGKVRAADGDYLSLLSSNARGQIRRSLKDEDSALSVQAADAASANAWLAQMYMLNAGRHQDNAWDSEFFRDFVRRITHAGLADGSVELLRFSGAGGTIGYLLNFLWAGRAMNYQSAFAAPASSKSKPGFMCHASAVSRYAGQGLSRYSLLAGRDRYKQSLSTGADLIEWTTLERFDWRLEAEAVLRRIFGVTPPSRAD